MIGLQETDMNKTATANNSFAPSTIRKSLEAYL